MNGFKILVTSILNLIHQKLKTKEGQLALIIVASLITGASIVTIYLKGVRIDELISDKKERAIETKEKVLEIKELKQEIKYADSNCNDKILKGVLFQKELKAALDGKIEINTEIVNQKIPLLKEKENMIKNQKKTIQELKQLNDRL